MKLKKSAEEFELDSELLSFVSGQKFPGFLVS
jgi:hypothetical protein